MILMTEKLTKHPLSEIWTQDVQLLTEEVVNGFKLKKFGGIIMQADAVNKNKRVYPLDLMVREVNKFKQMIENRKAIGELDHPDDVEINLDRISHRWTKIEMRGNNVYGEAVILPTDKGKILEGLFVGGVQLGVSSRAGGALKKDGDHYKVIDFDLAAIDVVFENSAPKAEVGLINESLCKNGVCNYKYKQENEINYVELWKKYFTNLT